MLIRIHLFTETTSSMIRNNIKKLGGIKMDCPYYDYNGGNYYCNLCKNTVNEAKHDCYCTDYNGTNYQNCDIYNRYG